MNPSTLTWMPSETAARKLLLWGGVLLMIVAAIAFSLSFDSVMIAARPFFGDAAWAIPLLMDATMFVLTSVSVAMELNGLRAPAARYGSRGLALLTVYANIAPQRGLYARILHGAPPSVWVLSVVVVESAVRKLVGLSDERRIEGLRRSLWVLRPWPTWRLYRQMRIHQITTYRAALDRDAARATIIGRMRLHHGRMWRAKAPLAERIALRLEGRDVEGVADILRTHADTAALLSAPAGHADNAPVSEADSGRTRAEAVQAVADMRADCPDMSAAEMATRLALSERTIRRYLKELPPPTAQITHVNGHHPALEAAP